MEPEYLILACFAIIIAAIICSEMNKQRVVEQLVEELSELVCAECGVNPVVMHGQEPIFFERTYTVTCKCFWMGWSRTEDMAWNNWHSVHTVMRKDEYNARRGSK
jgi:hypothetical protein